MKYIFFLLLMIISSPSLIGQEENAPKSVQSGVEHYKNKEYIQALRIFNTSLSLGYESEELYYNIGNVHAQLKNLPEAIWAYEKALKINPHFTDARNNLKQLTKAIDGEIVHIKPFFLLNWWSQITKLFRPNIWAILCLLGLVIWASLLLAKWLNLKYFSAKLIVSSIFSWLIILGITYGSYYSIKYNKEAIVMNAQSIMHIGADERSDAVIQLPKGLKIKLLDQLKDWYKVELPNLSQGWVMVQDVKEI